MSHFADIMIYNALGIYDNLVAGTFNSIPEFKISPIKTEVVPISSHPVSRKADLFDRFQIVKATTPYSRVAFTKIVIAIDFNQLGASAS